MIEFCDIFDTVKETGDHGSFNSWGRDRYWGIQGIDLGTVALGADANLPVLDVVRTNILRNTRWRCDHGWDIDLDDGSTLYEIRNNLCLHGGLKNREGFYRVVENNIIVNNSFHPHVWYGNSKDVFSRNIVCTPYRPVMKAPWGLGAREIDFNLVHQTGAAAQPAALLQQSSGRDAHSLIADALFVDSAKGDYRVKDGSPALKLGFQNFPMDQFGVQSPKLKALARTPELPVVGEMKEEKSKRDGKPALWLGAKIKNVIGLGEVSAAGLPGEVGVALLEVPAGSAAAKAGLKERDVILKCAGRSADTVKQLLRVWNAAAKGDKLKLEIWRDQKAATLDIIANEKATGSSDAKRTPVIETKIVIEARNDDAFTTIPCPSATDAAQGCKVSTESPTANEKTAALTDGKLATNYGPVFPNGVFDGVYRLDLGAPKTIAQVNTYSFNLGGKRGRQIFALYGSVAAD
ncbi:MAG: PDZ domain-containing protein, partial [Kiritimatiellaeota bacterium]|nr:PDZ domain-containing protein [Kiritimatiellota bacterium]